MNMLNAAKMLSSSENPRSGVKLKEHVRSLLEGQVDLLQQFAMMPYGSVSGKRISDASCTSHTNTEQVDQYSNAYG